MRRKQSFQNAENTPASGSETFPFPANVEPLPGIVEILATTFTHQRSLSED